MSDNFDPGTMINPNEKVPAVSDMIVSRSAQEVQAAIIIAKKFPRNETTSNTRILIACQRKGLAEEAEYTYPKGGKNVSGASIRLAETIARYWGNIDYGIIELTNRNGVSEMMAYAWDLETNTRITKIFSVKHWRDTQSGGHALKDIRDIYELTANYGARRVRACILGIIPSEITEEAVQKCRETLKGSYKVPLEDRFKKMVFAFQDELNVTQKQIEEYLGCNMASFNENHFLNMKGVYRSIQDGMSQPKDYFKVAPVAAIGSDVPNPFANKPPEPTTIEIEDEKLRKELRELHPTKNEWEIDALLIERKKQK